MPEGPRGKRGYGDHATRVIERQAPRTMRFDACFFGKTGHSGCPGSRDDQEVADDRRQNGPPRNREKLPAIFRNFSLSPGSCAWNSSAPDARDYCEAESRSTGDVPAASSMTQEREGNQA